tara:strand:- start:1034 stop:3097 length:2064 start_codon:yes stop_codon:yes gene_type:complete
MAEKVVLEAEIKTNVSKQQKDTEKYVKSLEQVNEEIKLQNKYILDQEKELVKLKAKQDAIPKGSWVAGMDKLNQKIKDTTAELKVEKVALKGLKEEQKEAIAKNKELTAAQKEQDKVVQDGIGSFTVMGVSLNGVKTSMGKLIPTIKMMFGSIKAGLISTGIGAFVVAIGSLVSYFTNTKRGADQLKQALAGLGAATSVITDLFSRVGETIVGAFEDPKAAITGLWEFIKDNLMNRLTGVIDSFKAAGKIIKSALELDFDAVKEGAKEYGQALVQVGTGLDVEQQEAFANSIKNITTEIKEEVKAMTALEKRTQALRDADNEFMVQKAATRKEIEKARLIAEDESKSAEERLDNLKKALELEAETTEQEIELAKERMRIQEEEMALSENSAEDEANLAQLKAAIIEKETASIKMRRRVVTEVNALENEIAANRKAEEDARQAEIDKKNAEDAAALKKKETEAQALLNIQQQNTLALIEDLAERARQELEIQEQKELASVAGMDNAEAMKEAIQKKYAIKRKALDDKTTADELKNTKMINDMQVGFAADTLGAISKIAGEETAVGKAAAVAQATVAGAQSVMNAFNTASNSPLNAIIPGYNFIQAGLAGAFAVKQIAAVKSGQPPSGGAGGGGGTPDVAPESPAPQMMSGAFELSGGVEPEPTRAYVLTDEMTSSQNQLANIRRRATI